MSTTGNWLNKFRHTCNIEYYSADKKNEVALYAQTRESVQPMKLKHVAIRHVWGEVSGVPGSFYIWAPGWLET